MKLIHVVWFTREKCFGIAVGEDEITKERKAYIGIVPGIRAEVDAKNILENGARVYAPMLEEIVMMLRKEDHSQKQGE